jgi:hypothetical protein
MGTFYALKNKSVNIPGLAVLCMGICDECAERCEEINSAKFQQCAAACRYCSNTLSELAIPFLKL